jgi:hypothetical protein
VDVAPTAADVANILVYVVPGFFARLGYLARFPQRRQETAYALIVSVAASVPLVAIVNEIAEALGLEANPVNAVYCVSLVVVGLCAGYLTAVARGWQPIRDVLGRIGIPFQPEATIYERVLVGTPETLQVTVTFEDGQVVGGYPADGPSFVEAGEVREMFLDQESWWDYEKCEWSEPGNGVIVNLDQVRAVALSERPPSRGE